ncbi:glucose-6-phosphate dehydrogenase, partial [Candidatus Roizmanbacteria bacterium]|nr:glucose-6-phosphate dehydrogenase [Candidatus Roizmanbacteria bacterium]
MNRKNFPTILVIFGATGDLMGKKIVPALFHLYKKNKLPPLFQVLGVARRPFTHAEFRENVSALLAKHDEAHLTDASLAGFTRCFFYEQGDFRETDSYRSLARVMGRIDGEWKVCANKLFYLAVPPQYYETIFHQLASSGLTLPCSPAEGWTRVIVEKPFGHDLTTAEKLDLLLAKLFKEEQIYRIDHYLAKEMLQNILSFRFSNNLLEQSWNNKNIERIDIRLLEKIGVEGRGGFYDPVGALRDVGQNHLLQMLALITMEQPKVMNAKEVRYLRARLLQDLRLPGMKEAIAESFRGQYVGYDRIEGVKKDSQTETYFKIKAHLDSPRWQGVPIFMESGKRMKKQLKEIMVTFKHVTPCLCPPGKHYKNKVVFQLEPEERIQICFLSKKPGLEMEIEDRSLDFVYRSTVKRRQYVEEYE